MAWTGGDAETHQVITCHSSDRSRYSTKELRPVIPEACHEQATLCTAQYEAYNGVISDTRHKAIMKKACRELAGDRPMRERTWAPGGHRRAPLLVCHVRRHERRVIVSERRTSWSLH